MGGKGFESWLLSIRVISTGLWIASMDPHAHTRRFGVSDPNFLSFWIWNMPSFHLHSGRFVRHEWFKMSEGSMHCRLKWRRRPIRGHGATCNPFLSMCINSEPLFHRITMCFFNIFLIPGWNGNCQVSSRPGTPLHYHPWETTARPPLHSSSQKWDQ